MATSNGQDGCGHAKDNKLAGGGSHWITWDAQWVRNMPDPTRIFTSTVLGTIVFKYLIENEWNLQFVIFGFFLNPYVLFSFAVSIGVAFHAGFTWKSFYALPVYDRWAVEWYFWNAALYHMIMDGFTGTFGVVPLVLYQYQQLDFRFISHHSVPWLVGLVELFVHAPFCLLSMWAILKNHPLRYPMELITGVLHIFGMVMFIGAEIYEGQLNVPSKDPVGISGNMWANVKFNDFYQFTYYWFGFWFCNLVWLFVPYVRMVRAVDEICRKFAEGSKRE